MKSPPGKRGNWSGGEHWSVWSVYLVYFVCSVYSVFSVCLVCLVCLVYARFPRDVAFGGAAFVRRTGRSLRAPF